MPGMGPGQPGIGQPAAAAPLAQAESAADFNEQVICHKISDFFNIKLPLKVARMREMGIVDEGLALRALQIMGGDLQVPKVAKILT